MLTTQHLKKKNGFTLIELLVTTTIIAILMGVGIVAYNQAGKSARDAKRKTDLEAFRQAMMLYRADNGIFATVANNYTATAQILVTAQYLQEPIQQEPLSMAVPSMNALAQAFNINAYAAALYPYTYRGNTTQFCTCALMENGKGNSTAGADLSCSGISTSGTAYYCVKGF